MCQIDIFQAFSYYNFLQLWWSLLKKLVVERAVSRANIKFSGRKHWGIIEQILNNTLTKRVS